MSKTTEKFCLSRGEGVEIVTRENWPRKVEKKHQGRLRTALKLDHLFSTIEHAIFHFLVYLYGGLVMCDEREFRSLEYLKYLNEGRNSKGRRERKLNIPTLNYTTTKYSRIKYCVIKQFKIKFFMIKYVGIKIFQNQQISTPNISKLKVPKLYTVKE